MLSLRNSSVALTGLLALGITSVANAQIIATSREIGSLELAAVGPVVYSGIPDPYSAFARATGVLSTDDYQAATSAPTFVLDNLQFVGGVGATNGIIDINFFNSAQTFVTGFGVQLPQAGDFIWTISGLSNLGAIPSNGFMQLTARTGSTGRWFFTTTAPTIGTNSTAVGTGSGLNPQRNNAFQLTSAVPEPGSVALLIGMTTMGGMLVLRRRRK